ncbi:MAG: phosphatidate cytidylyltransferase [Planctomycetota bacterium]
MATRILIGTLLVGGLAVVGWLDWAVFERPLASRILLWSMAVLALHEVIAIAARRVECYPGLPLFGAVAVAAVVVPALVWQADVKPELILLAALLGAGIRFLGLAPLRSAPAAFPEAAVLFAGIGYTAGTLTFLDRILLQQGVVVVLCVVAISKTSDVMGYFVGTLFGRRRIAPAVSPKKSWEGTIAAVLGSGCMAVLLREQIGQDVLHALVIGLLIGGASFLGDLIESGFKRWGGVKDSSALLPEFGGFLDMLDGILLAAPVAVVCLFGS